MDQFIFSILDNLNIVFLIVVIAAMLLILSKGADLLVDEAVRLSVHIGVPKIIIGATIVSLGTTLPEATISVFAAIQGNPDLALGNAIGSVIADTGLIIGIAALIGTLPVDKIVVNRQGKIQVWVGILLAIICLPFLSDGNIAQCVGWILLLLLVIYIYISIKWSRKSQELDNNIFNDSSDDQFESKKSPVIMQILRLMLGIVLVIGSSKVLIPAVEISAIRVGIPQSIIAATLIAFGTSLPELITAVTAVKKGHGELAIGNVVGADILNILFVVGSAAAVTSSGLNVPNNFYKLQIPAMLIILMTFRFFTLGKKAEITKREGFTLLSLYLIYLLLNYFWI